MGDISLQKGFLDFIQLFHQELDHFWASQDILLLEYL